jgi:hypothetical protein
LARSVEVQAHPRQGTGSPSAYAGPIKALVKAVKAFRVAATNTPGGPSAVQAAQAVEDARQDLLDAIRNDYASNAAEN